jgi:hypothetical protein
LIVRTIQNSVVGQFGKQCQLIGMTIQNSVVGQFGKKCQLIERTIQMSVVGQFGKKCQSIVKTIQIYQLTIDTPQHMGIVLGQYQFDYALGCDCFLEILVDGSKSGQLVIVTDKFKYGGYKIHL